MRYWGKYLGLLPLLITILLLSGSSQSSHSAAGLQQNSALQYSGRNGPAEVQNPLIKSCLTATVALEVLKEDLELRAEEGSVYFDQQLFCGRSTRYYPNGVLAEAIDYQEGQREGYHRKWFPDGRLSFESRYRNGKQDGYTRSWWSNGQVRTASYLESGVSQGLQLQWYSSGQLFKRIQLINGREDGLQQSWRENGKIYNNYEVVNGRIFGLKRSNLCYSLDNEVIQFAD